MHVVPGAKQGIVNSSTAYLPVRFLLPCFALQTFGPLSLLDMMLSTLVYDVVSCHLYGGLHCRHHGIRLLLARGFVLLSAQGHHKQLTCMLTSVVQARPATS